MRLEFGTLFCLQVFKRLKILLGFVQSALDFCNKTSIILIFYFLSSFIAQLLMVWLNVKLPQSI